VIVHPSRFADRISINDLGPCIIVQRDDSKEVVPTRLWRRCTEDPMLVSSNEGIALKMGWFDSCEIQRAPHQRNAAFADIIFKQPMKVLWAYGHPASKSRDDLVDHR